MTYLAPADFREASLHEVCTHLSLTDEEATNAQLTAAIARMTARIDRWTLDHYEPTTAAVDVNGAGGLNLYLPARYTAVTAVKTYDSYGTLSAALDPTSYRLRSSLNAAGTERIEGRALDWLELVSGTLDCWPAAAKSVQVTGTYGWASCPTEIKRALALLVWDHFKRIGDHLRVAEQVSGQGVIQRFQQPDPAAGIFSGINEADEIVAEYSRKVQVRVA